MPTKCDHCEEYNDNLFYVEGEWVCKSCKYEEENDII